MLRAGIEALGGLDPLARFGHEAIFRGVLHPTRSKAGFRGDDYATRRRALTSASLCRSLGALQEGLRWRLC
jgi:hypothetical protein